jgi:hypothetical protein
MSEDRSAAEDRSSQQSSEDRSASEDRDVVRLAPWTGPWPDDDPDANFKAEVALYSLVDPLTTVEALSANIDVPVGALCRYVLARWASGGSGGLLELGPSMVQRLWDVCEQAEADATDEARLAAYDQLRQMLSWLRLPLVEPAGYGDDAP